jgi:hypothetical protein
MSGTSSSFGVVAGRLAFMDGYSELDGIHQTDLGQRLSEPPFPTYKRIPGCTIAAGIFLFSIAVSFLALMVGMFTQGLLSFGKTTAASLLFMIVFLACVNLLVTPIVVMAINFLRRASASKTIPRWQQAMSRWQTLYYCCRDDIVFEPGMMDYVSSYDMHRLL